MAHEWDISECPAVLSNVAGWEILYQWSFFAGKVIELLYMMDFSSK
jgi:hypothetical protein